MEISATFFKNIYDNKTHKRMNFSDFNEFEEFLYNLSKRKLGGKKDAQLISPATYVANTTRANKNVVDWGGWAAVDVDDHKIEGDLENELRNLYGMYYYICYSTASSRESYPKFRLVFPTKRRVGSNDIRSFWFALNNELGQINDQQTKDLSRMYYIPGTYTGAFNFMFTNNTGVFLDPQALMEKHPFVEKLRSSNFLDRLPEELQKQVIQHRKEKAENTNVYWTGYSDCPFVNKKLIAEYKSIAHIDNSGRYGMIYKIMVSIAINAIKSSYPINSQTIVGLIKQLDSETSNRYGTRPLDVEADRAIEFAYRNV